MVSTRFSSAVNEGASTSAAPDHAAVVARVTRNSSTAMAAAAVQAAVVAATAASAAGPGLLDLPPELVEKVLSFLPFKNVCQLRLVCRTMDRICGQLLNSAFQRLQTQMLNRFQAIKSKMPRRESARRNHHLACESDIIETLYMRLTLLQMSFGKHIERKHCCFFPGEILDEVYNVLNYIRTNTKLARPYKVTDELFDLSTMAMEYFKDKIEPELPEIAYFGTDFLDLTVPRFPTSSNNKYLELDSSPLGPEEPKDADRAAADGLDAADLDAEPLPAAPSHQHQHQQQGLPPQSNMVLRKRIRKIKQGMRRYNSQLSLLRNDLRSCKRKTAEQQRQIGEQQKQLAEQQKQTLEYATRLDEYDKKNEEISRKFSTLLQELNKCKTELQYWRSKSPATPPFCTGCGNSIPPPIEEIQALMNQGVHPEGLGIDPISEFAPIPGTSGGGGGSKPAAATSASEQQQQQQQQQAASETANNAKPQQQLPQPLSSSSEEANLPPALPSVAGTSSQPTLRKRKVDEAREPAPAVAAAPAKKPRRAFKERSKRGKV